MHTAMRSIRRRWPARLLWSWFLLAVPGVAAWAQTISVPATASFASTASTPNPAFQDLALRNTGAATMTGVTIAAPVYAAGEPINWLSANNVSTGSNANASIAAGGTHTLRVSVAPGSLPAGTYHVSVAVTAANATNSPQTVSVTLDVAGPTISVPATATFASTSATPNPGFQDLVLRNSGSTTLAGVTIGAPVYAAGEPINWLSANNVSTGSNTNASIGAGVSNTLRLSVAPGVLPAGTYHASVPIGATNATNGATTVDVTFTVAGPTIALPATASFSSTNSANPPFQDLALRNTGSTTMAGVTIGAPVYAAGEPTNWLTANNVSTGSNANATLGAGGTHTIRFSTVNATSLPDGTYHANVAVSATNATNSPQVVSVTLVVSRTPATLATATTSLSFSSLNGGVTPGTTSCPIICAQDLTVTNAAPSGGEVLSNVVVGAISYGAGQPTGWLTRRLLANNGSAWSTSAGAVTVGTLTGTQAIPGLGVYPVPTALPNGTYTASFAITADQTNGTPATGSPLTITVTLVVNRTPATLAAATTSLSFSSLNGGVTPGTTSCPIICAQDLTVTNAAPSGGEVLSNVVVGAISYGAGQPTGWLTRRLLANNGSAWSTSAGAVTVGTLTGTQAIQGLGVYPVPTALPNGTYTASFAITADQTNGTPATGSPLTITVTLVVNRTPATLAAATTSLSFSSLNGGVTPGTTSCPIICAQDLTVTNAAPSGGEVLSNVVVGAISYGAGQPTGWLTRRLLANNGSAWSTSAGAVTVGTLTGTQAIQGLGVYPVPTALPNGTYTASFAITADQTNGTPATGSPLTITVTLTNGTPPIVQINPGPPGGPGAPPQPPPPPGTPPNAAIIASTWTGGPNPPTLPVSITNGTSGTSLTGLVVTSITYASGQPTNWLAASLAGTSAPTTLNLNATVGTLSIGSYRADVTIDAPSTGTTAVIPVVWTITAPPAIAVNTTQINITRQQGDPKPGVDSTSLSIGNTGGGNLTGIGLTPITYGAGEPTGWLTITPHTTAGYAAPRFTASTTGLNPGAYTATVPVVSSAPGVVNSGVNVITVKFTVTAPPQPTIALSTGSTGGLFFKAVVGTGPTAAQQVHVTNSGTGTLGNLLIGSISYQQGQGGWLSAALTSVSAPADIDVVATPGSLVPGTYKALVNVVSGTPGVTNSPQAFQVNFDVIALPTIAAGPVGFAAQTGGASPAARTIPISNTTSGSVDGLAVQSVTYAAGEPTGWLATSLPNGTTSTFGAPPATLTLTPTLGTLPQGIYHATVRLTSTTAVNAPYDVAVTMDVNGLPVIAFTPPVLNFTAIRLGVPAPPQSTVVSNTGTGTLQPICVDSVQYGQGQQKSWLTLPSLGSSNCFGPIPYTMSVYVANGAGLQPAVMSAKVWISSPVASNTPQFFTVNYTLLPAPAIALNPTRVQFNVRKLDPDPSPQTVAVTNIGAGTLDLAVGTIVDAQSNPVTWLAATLDASTAPATLTLKATKANLTPGTYFANVQVTSTTGINAPQYLPVDFFITQPLLHFNPPTLLFTATQNGPNPPVQTDDLTNVGTGTLDQVTVGPVQYTSGQPTGWLVVSTSGTTAPFTVTFAPKVGTLTPGTYTARVPASSPVAGNSPVYKDVSFTVVQPPPTIALDKTSLLFTVATSSPTPSPQQVVKITNSGGGTLGQLGIGTLAYDPAGPKSWLTTTLSTTTAPATVTLRATGAAFATTSSATVVMPVVSPQGVNGPQNVTVTIEAWKLADASAALTVPNKLTAAQMARLDLLGNNNGRYDMADYLALLQRAGLAAGPVGP